MEKTLVAALGFEPTAGLSDDAADLLIDDGSGDALDWSGSEATPDVDDPDIEVQESESAADGARADDAPPKSTSKVSESTMTPPKGKGKGPRTYKNSPKKGSGSSGSKSDSSKSNVSKSDASKSDTAEAADDDLKAVAGVKSDSKTSSDTDSDSTKSNGRKSGSSKSGSTKVEAKTTGAPKTVRVSDIASDKDSDLDLDLDTDADPADLIDADSSGVKPVETDVDDKPKSWASEAASKAEDKPKHAAAKSTSDRKSKAVSGTDETGPLPVGGLDETGPLPTTLADDPPPPVVDDAVSLDPTPDLVADATSVPAAETLIVEAPPEAPVEEAAPVAPVVDPPPPIVGDPVPDATAETNGHVAKPGVVGRVGAATTPKGDLAGRVPQLLDQGFLKRTRRVRARKVRRVVRHIDPWSILTFSVLFFLCLFSALLLASVLVWNAAVAAGTIENIESFIREIGDYQTYEIKGDVVFRGAMVIAGIMTLAASVMVVLLVVVFNLISDLVGGIRVTVVEEETVRVRRRQKQ